MLAFEYLLKALGAWANCLTLLCLSFLTCKMEIKKSLSWRPNEIMCVRRLVTESKPINVHYYFYYTTHHFLDQRIFFKNENINDHNLDIEISSCEAND